MMDTFAAESIRLCLKKMFRPGGWFCIIDLQQCLKIAQIEAPAHEIETLRALHCIHWSEMTPEMRVEVKRRVLTLFSLPETDLSDLLVPMIGGAEQAPTTLFRRLLGKGADA